MRIYNFSDYCMAKINHTGSKFVVKQDQDGQEYITKVGFVDWARMKVSATARATESMRLAQVLYTWHEKELIEGKKNGWHAVGGQFVTYAHDGQTISRQARFKYFAKDLGPTIDNLSAKQWRALHLIERHLLFCRLGYDKKVILGDGDTASNCSNASTASSKEYFTRARDNGNPAFQFLDSREMSDVETDVNQKLFNRHISAYDPISHRVEFGFTSHTASNDNGEEPIHEAINPEWQKSKIKMAQRRAEQARNASSQGTKTQVARVSIETDHGDPKAEPVYGNVQVTNDPHRDDYATVAFDRKAKFSDTTYATVVPARTAKDAWSALSHGDINKIKVPTTDYRYNAPTIGELAKMPDSERDVIYSSVVVNELVNKSRELARLEEEQDKAIAFNENVDQILERYELNQDSFEAFTEESHEGRVGLNRGAVTANDFAGSKRSASPNDYGVVSYSIRTGKYSDHYAENPQTEAITHVFVNAPYIEAVKKLVARNMKDDGMPQEEIEKTLARIKYTPASDVHRLRRNALIKALQDAKKKGDETDEEIIALKALKDIQFYGIVPDQWAPTPRDVAQQRGFEADDAKRQRGRITNEAVLQAKQARRGEV